MDKPITKFKIKGMQKDTEFLSLAFGRQIDGLRQIRAFKDTAKSFWVSKKRKNPAKEIKDTLKFYNATEHYYQYNDSPNYSDDSFEVFFK